MNDPNSGPAQDERSRFFDLSRDLLCILSFDGSFRQVNSVWERVLGYSPEELVAKPLVNFIHPDDRDATLAEIERLVSSATSLTFENRWLGKDGSYRWFAWTVNSLPDEQLIYASARDVSARKRTEGELRIFKAVVDNAPDSVGLSNLEGRIFYANEAQKTVSGYGDALIGMNFYDLYPEESHPAIAAAGQVVVEQGFWQGTFNWKHKDGHLVPIQATVFLFHDAKGAPLGYASIIRDITEQLRIEQERIGLQEQVIAAQDAALRELSTPLIPLADTVVAMPLIGSIDTNRAQQVIETLLSGVAHNRATSAIIDITGVPVVDSQVANTLLHAAQAIKLLGAQAILTGIRPEVAQTLVGLGLDLSGFVTRSTLQSGIAYALKRAAQH